jgi:hypothetical protein
MPNGLKSSDLTKELVLACSAVSASLEPFISGRVLMIERSLTGFITSRLADSMAVKSRQSKISKPGRVIMRQNWRELLFVHWQNDPQLIAETLPQGLTLDTFEDKAYLGIVAFRMNNVSFGLIPPTPGLSALNEINLRTYVRDQSGRKGIYFYSLDATLRIAVWIAQRFFHLPYKFASVSYSDDPGENSKYYEFQRHGDSGSQDRFVYTTSGEEYISEPESLEEFLVERYSFYTPHNRKKRLVRGNIYHEPYNLRQTDLTAYGTSLFRLNGFDQPSERPCHVVSSPGVDVLIYPLEMV